jgi:hypothetical protein
VLSLSMIKYTKELLEEAVQNSSSYAGILRFLGLRQAGGTQAWIIRKVKSFDLDTSHFSMQSHNKGKVSPARKSAAEILIVLPDGSHRAKRLQLERALLEVGFEYKCSECALLPEWNNKSLTLEIDHIDGNWLNNLEENLRFLCPNCHSQQISTNKSHKYKAA